jgi:hypothetical protein
MNNWDLCEFRRLTSEGREKTAAKIRELKNSIARADKRTHNGKATAMFDGASLRVAEDAYNVLCGGETPERYKNRDCNNYSCGGVCKYLNGGI